MRDGRLLTGYRSDDGVGRMEKREIDELEPYLGKRNGFSWLPQRDTNYYANEAVHATLKLSQQERDIANIPDYIAWSIGNFILFFPLGIICIILSVRVREHRLTHDYDRTLKISKRALTMNVFTTLCGIVFGVSMIALLFVKSTSSF